MKSEQQKPRGLDTQHDHELYEKLARTLHHAIAHFARANDTISGKAVFAACVHVLIDVCKTTGINLPDVMETLRHSWVAEGRVNGHDS